MLVCVRWTSRGGQVGKREVMLNEKEGWIVLTNQRAKCLAWLSGHAARSSSRSVQDPTVFCASRSHDPVFYPG